MSGSARDIKNRQHDAYQRKINEIASGQKSAKFVSADSRVSRFGQLPQSSLEQKLQF
ncbi:TPA: hypothetical protein ACPY9J_002246 [Yersinia enterocolitica]